MNSHSLQSLIATSKPLLIHVLPEEVFQAKHIVGSHNACVYEMAFLDQVGLLTVDKTQPIVVYGAGEGSLDAPTAAAKLRAAGYTNVEVFEDGIAGWEVAGLPLDGTQQLPASAVLDGRFVVDAKESVVRWTGRNLFNHHNGTVKLNDGEIILSAGELVSAKFSIDMTSIGCEDLTDETWNAMLIKHLHNEDFFDVAKHPQSSFVAKRVEKLANSSDGSPNYLLHGQFTLRAITKPVQFPVVIASADGNRLTGQAQFELDRTEFGSHYGSGKFFRFLGKHVVNDLVHLHIKLHADRMA